MKLSTLSQLRPRLAACALAALAPAAFGEATQVGSTLTVLGSPSEDVITVVFDVTPGQARVFGVPGTPDGTLFSGVAKLVAKTFASTDIVVVQSLSATPPELDLDTGDGESQVRVDIQTPFSLQPTYSKALVRGAASKDSVLFEIAENALGGTYDYTVLGAAGENDAQVKFSSDVLGGATTLNWRYFGGSSNDKVLLDFVSKADDLTLNAFGLTGGGGDEWFIKASGDVNTTARIQTAARLGAGGDSALVDTSNCGSSVLRGGIDAGDGDDAVEFKTTSRMSGSPVLLGGLGNDILLVSVGADLLAGSNPRLLAGEGNDTVSMLVGSAVLGSPYSDGGPGNDSFTGVGVAVNFE
jgi:hypothetical protein